MNVKWSLDRAECGAVCEVVLRTKKWIVKSKSLENVAFKSLVDFQRYLAEYSRAFDNVCEYMFTHALKFIPLVYIGLDKRSTLSRWNCWGDKDKAVTTY